MFAVGSRTWRLRLGSRSGEHCRLVLPTYVGCYWRRYVDHFLLNNQHCAHYSLAAFDYDFSALDNEDNELARSCRGLLYVYSRLRHAIVEQSPSSLELFARPPSFGVLVITIAKYIPHKIWEWILLNSRSPQVERAKKHEKLASNVARALLDAKADLLKHGDGNLDVMSRIGMLVVTS